MSENTIFQFAHGVLVCNGKQLNQASEKRDLSIDEMPANPMAGNVVEISADEGKDESGEAKSDAPDTNKPAATTEEAPKVDVKTAAPAKK
jgi:hypothetical protein